MDFWQHTYAEEYTASENTDFYTSLFNITTTRQFGDFVPEKTCKTLSSFPLFSEMTMSVEDLEERTTKIIVSLCIGFQKRYLVGYPEGQLSSILIWPESSIAGVE